MRSVVLRRAEGWPGRAVARGLPFAAVWVLLAGVAPGAWLIGAPALALAVWSSLWLRRESGPGISLPGGLRFIGFFAAQSVRGGLDVAGRTLGRRVRIQPGFRDYRTGLPAGRPRLLLANCVTLFPGTLTASLRGDTLSLHVLDLEADLQADLVRLEGVIAGLFGCPIEGADA